jgi:hypothetical protein
MAAMAGRTEHIRIGYPGSKNFMERLGHITGVDMAGL